MNRVLFNMISILYCLGHLKELYMYIAFTIPVSDRVQNNFNNQR